MAGSCFWCGRRSLLELAVFTAPAPGEKIMGIDVATYSRRLLRCLSCGHIANRHRYERILSKGYANEYRSAAYGKNLRKRFEKIRSLPLADSDNQQRVAFLTSWMHSKDSGSPQDLLDIGSGTGVFVAEMRDLGWKIAATDVDPISTDHVKSVAAADVATGPFLEILDVNLPGDPPYFLITMNKVLEHVSPKVALAMLRRVLGLLDKNGWLYIELPDGEAALEHGGVERQEFYLEHFGVFSVASTALMIHRAGGILYFVERIKEPSGKYTIRGLVKNQFLEIA